MMNIPLVKTPTAKSLPENEVRPGQGTSAYRKITVNMPQMALEGLSENWLFKELGDIHWHLLHNGLQTRSAHLKDEAGNRVHATFVRTRFVSSIALNEFNESEELETESRIMRSGNSLYLSNILMNSPKGTLDAELITSFSSRDKADNCKLVRSLPATRINLIEEHATIPEFVEEYKQIKKGMAAGLYLDGVLFPISDDIIFRHSYELNPFYDMNGAGLLYFAAYPTINDICEMKCFGGPAQDGKRWEQAYYTVARDVLYFSNCNIDDRIEYRVNHFAFMEEDKVRIASSLYRQSDGQLMARIFTIKRKKQ
jgi:probable biosynthetic protein (TIGR04098 family)